MKKDFFIELQRAFLFALLLFLPFFTHYLTKSPFAFSYINLFSLLFIAGGIINTGRGLPLPGVKDRGLLLLLAAFFLVMIYALLFTHPLRNGLGIMVSRVSQPALVGYFVYQLLAAKRLRLEELLFWLLLSLIPLSLVSLNLVFHPLSSLHPGRLYLPYEFPNTLARYIVIVLIITFPWLLRERFATRIYSGLWLLGVILLVGTVSYNGIISFIGGLAVMLWLLPREWKILRQRGLEILAGVMAFLLLFARQLPKWQTSITDSRLTRLEFWQVARGALQHHYWTGIGLKGWETQYGQLVVKYGPNHPPLNWISEQPHNFFLDSLLKAGIPGLLIITALLIWPLGQAWRLRQNSAFHRQGWLAVAVIGYTVALLLFGLIDDPLWSDDTMPLLFMALFSLAWAKGEAA